MATHWVEDGSKSTCVSPALFRTYVSQLILLIKTLHIMINASTRALLPHHPLLFRNAHIVAENVFFPRRLFRDNGFWFCEENRREMNFWYSQFHSKTFRSIRRREIDSLTSWRMTRGCCQEFDVESCLNFWSKKYKMFINFVFLLRLEKRYYSSAVVLKWASADSKKS